MPQNANVRLLPNRLRPIPPVSAPLTKDLCLSFRSLTHAEFFYSRTRLRLTTHVASPAAARPSGVANARTLCRKNRFHRFLWRRLTGNALDPVEPIQAGQELTCRRLPLCPHGPLVPCSVGPLVPAFTASPARLPSPPPAAPNLARYRSWPRPGPGDET